MEGEYRLMKPGETFYMHGEKYHYVGVISTGDELVHVTWSWSKYKRRRVYYAIEDKLFEIDWEYMRETK